MNSAVEGLEVRSPSKLFKALGDPTRLRIVALLAQAELCVCHIEAALGLPQPTVSRHLAVLRNAGVVEPERRGTWMFYQLADQTDRVARRQLRGLVTAFRENDELRAEVRRLLRSKGPDACR
jgi:ArsR family transcriptional regulator, arsenate/arsenite/antimonite-responsive transcriptional repressor